MEGIQQWLLFVLCLVMHLLGMVGFSLLFKEPSVFNLKRTPAPGGVNRVGNAAPRIMGGGGCQLGP